MVLFRKSHLIVKIMSQSLLDLLASINILLWWSYGSLLLLFLIIQILTGMLLSMHYCPNTKIAFMFFIYIVRNVNRGWLLYNIYINSVFLFFLYMYLHVVRRIYYNSFYLKETWNIGIIIFITVRAIAFIGYALLWDQIRFWGATVIINIFSAIPYIGIELVQWLWGRLTLTSLTLNRFFILHFLLPLLLLLIVAVHIIFLHKNGFNNLLGINSDCERISFYTYFRVKDIIGFFVAIGLFIIIVLFALNFLSDSENFSKVSPLATPSYI